MYLAIAAFGDRLTQATLAIPATSEATLRAIDQVRSLLVKSVDLNRYVL